MTVKELNDKYIKKFEELLNRNTDYSRHKALTNKVNDLEAEKAELIAKRAETINNNGDPEAIVQFEIDINNKTKFIDDIKKMADSIDWKHSLPRDEYLNFIAEYRAEMDKIIQPKKKACREYLSKAAEIISELETYKSRENREFEKANEALQYDGFDYSYISYDAMAAKPAILNIIRNV